LMDNIMNY